MGSRLPEDVQVSVVEESAQTIYLVLPVRSAELQTGELSDQELEVVAGGDATWDDSPVLTCANTCQCP
jgi:hypothetical protein